MDWDVTMQAPVRARRSSAPILESVEILVALLIMGLGWVVWYLARERYYLSLRQVAEIATYLAIGLISGLSSAILIITRRSRKEREWPHPPMVVPRERDELLTREAWGQSSVVLGY